MQPECIFDPRPCDLHKNQSTYNQLVRISVEKCFARDQLQIIFQLDLKIELQAIAHSFELDRFAYSAFEDHVLEVDPFVSADRGQTDGEVASNGYAVNFKQHVVTRKVGCQLAQRTHIGHSDSTLDIQRNVEALAKSY